MPLQGNTEAWFHLGVMHLNGWGVPRNVMQAQYFFSMTAKTVRSAVQQRAHLKPTRSMCLLLVEDNPATYSLMHFWQPRLLSALI